MSYQNKAILKSIIIYFSLVILFWLFHTIVAMEVFHRGSFMNLLILDIPLDEIYNRIAYIIFASFFYLILVLIYLKLDSKFNALELRNTKLESQHDVFLKSEEKYQELSTLLKQSENKRIESEEKFKSTYENAPLAFQSLNENGELINMNNSWLQSLGYEKKDVIGRWYGDFLHADYIEQFKRNFAEFKKNGEIHARQFKMRTNSGVYIDISFDGYIEYTDNNEFKQSFCILKDISEKVRAEKLLKETEEEFESIIMQAPFVVEVYNIEGLQILVNKAYEELWGFPAETTLNKFNLFDSKEVKDTGLLEYVKRAFSGEEVSVPEYSFNPKGKTESDGKGRVRWLNTKVYPVTRNDGQIKNIVITHKDVTNRMNAEIALKNSEMKFKGVFDYSNIGIALSDAQVNLIDVNDEFAKLVGYEKEELLKMNYTDITHPDDLKNEYERVLKLQSGEIDNYRLEKRYIHKQGHIVWVDIAVTSRKKSSGEIYMFMGMAMDITKHKKVQNDLVLAKENAETADRLKSAFLANMSHEIRTPMNGILGFTELLEEPSLTGEEQQQYINIIKKSGSRMLNTVNDIINVSQIDAGQVEIVLKTISVKEEIESLFTQFNPEIEQKGLQLILKYQLADEDEFIETDHVKFTSTLSNFIKNAIKYTDKGSIEIGIYKEDIFLKCYVKDTGIGIPEDRKTAIFNRFEQADIDDKLAKQGSGLGLSISKSYIEMLHGEINMESVLGKGSTFSFSIPWIKAKTPLTQETSHTENNKPENNNKLKILIAEDDDISYKHLHTILKDFCNEIIREKRGDKVIEMVEKHSGIDCVLMDIKMPIMDGYKATREIRKFNKDIVIIAQTAYALIDDRKKAINAGCNDYIIKPTDKDELIKIIFKHVKLN